MHLNEEIKRFYLENIPEAKKEGNVIQGVCPFCSSHGREEPGVIAAYVNPESFFMGYFRCLSRCIQGGFYPYFGRMMGLDPDKVPGYDPDREPFVQDIVYPGRNLNAEVKKYVSLMSEDQYNYFGSFGISKAVLGEMKIGYNGRYLVFPYFLEDGNCYACRCLMPQREEDNFWHGDERFFSQDFRIYNVEDIHRCEDGSLFITDGENDLLTLKELGYPGVAVPSAADLEVLTPERLASIKHIFLVMRNSPEAQLSARSLATRLGFKARILNWPSHQKGLNLSELAREQGKDFRATISSMIRASKSFSPFSSPEKEHRSIVTMVERVKGQEHLGMFSGFKKMDQALNGIHGITIMGGPPKTGKSCFFMQISTEMAGRRTPVIYYDFENGRRKIYMRTLCRLGRVSGEEIRIRDHKKSLSKRLDSAFQQFRKTLPYFRVVTDRKLNPDIMRRQIDFLQHETRKEDTLVVLDSLHKLPFKDLTDRRSGIDAWLRHMEAIRDEQNVSFLVVSELSRGREGGYSEKPELGSFKESGDIEYSADNAMVMLPDWDPAEPISNQKRRSTLWLVASRENSPGRIATYLLEYPYWGFREL